MTRRLLLLALLAVLVTWALQRWPQALAGLQGVAGVPASSWLVVAAGLSAGYLVRAWRLHAEWHRLVGVGRVECLHVTLQHTAAVHLLPMRAGEFGFPLLLRQRWGVPIGEGMAGLVALRFQDMCVVGWLGVVSAATAATLTAQVGPAAGLAGVVAACALWLVLGVLIRRAALQPDLDAAAPRRGWRQWLRLLAHAWRRTTPRTWALTLGNWVLKLGTLAFLYHAATVPDWVVAWMCALGGDTGAALPVQPAAGFGTFEAGAAMLGHWAGAAAPMPVLLGTALGVHLVLLFYALAAALVVALVHRGPAPCRVATTVAEPLRSQ